MCHMFTPNLSVLFLKWGYIFFVYIEWTFIVNIHYTGMYVYKVQINNYLNLKYRIFVW